MMMNHMPYDGAWCLICLPIALIGLMFNLVAGNFLHAPCIVTAAPAARAFSSWLRPVTKSKAIALYLPKIRYLHHHVWGWGS